MTLKTAYSPGEPIWVSLSSPDPDASRAFYDDLFSWTAPPGHEEFGGYASFELDGKKVAGLMPLMSPEEPPVWSCYVCTDDADKTTERVQQAGGTVVAAPMTVGDLGTMAVYVDGAGAFIGVWQSGQHRGAELVEQEGTLQWIELSTADTDGAKAFYAAVFGWDTNDSPDYTEFQQGGTSVAGLMAPPPGAPSGFWLPYFAAGDPGAKAEQVTSLGGTILVPAQDFPGGTFAVVQDPHGATFGLLNLPA